MILENPWSKRIRDADREAAADLFRIPAGTANGQYLLLRRYVSATPERFFDRTVQAEYASWLEDRHNRDANGLRDYLRSNVAEVEGALLFLHEINVEDWHDTAFETTNDWQFLRFVDRRIHPTYLRLL